MSPLPISNSFFGLISLKSEKFEKYETLGDKFFRNKTPDGRENNCQPGYQWPLSQGIEYTRSVINIIFYNLSHLLPPTTYHPTTSQVIAEEPIVIIILFFILYTYMFFFCKHF